jgi:hypothetical protein
MTVASQPSGWRHVAGHVAVRALFRSILINMAAPAILYQLAAPHFGADSLAPLAISSIPPILWVVYGVIKLRAVDFLGLFAVENAVVSTAALLIAHTERGALIGRSMQSLVLAGIFLLSLTFSKPLMFYMSRQLSTGNDPAGREKFDLAASLPHAMAAYRVLTWGWFAALLIKAAGTYVLAAHVPTRDFLLVSPLWDLISDSVLVAWTVFYGRARLSHDAQSAKKIVVVP